MTRRLSTRIEKIKKIQPLARDNECYKEIQKGRKGGRTELVDM